MPVWLLSGRSGAAQKKWGSAGQEQGLSAPCGCAEEEQEKS